MKRALIYGPLALGLATAAAAQNPSNPPAIASDASSHPAFVSVTSGARHSCALTADGAAWCWGANNLGQLGRGTPADSVPHPMPDSVRGGVRFTMIAAGADRTCGVSRERKAFCWGGQGSNLLGVKNAPADCSEAPKIASRPCALQPVEVDGRAVYVTLGVGSYHACGITSFGSINCWGANSYGQADENHTKGKDTPGRSVWDNRRFAAVSPGDIHSCALGVDGTVLCWGSNRRGQLGNGSKGNAPAKARPVAGSGFTSVSVNRDQSCALQGRAAFCWGNDETLSPTREAVEAGFTQLSLAMQYACGLAVGGAVYCWGTGTFGDSLRLSRTPKQIQLAGPARALGAGDSHVCVAGEDGKAYCWGDNIRGQLGRAGIRKSSAPVLVGAP
jgi:alpha-tubulin suppressor-like RCC1 family protein